MDRHEQEHVQDLRPPRRLRRPADGHRLVLRDRRAGHRARDRPRLRRRLVLVQRHARGQGRGCPARHRAGGARALRHRPGARPARRHPDAARLPLARGPAQRLRHRPRPGPRGRRGHPGPAPGARPRRAPRRARPRAEPREEPRHPHRLGRRRARDGHHLRRPHGDVGCDVHRRRQRPRQRQHLRRARDGDPRPDRRGADPDGAQPVPRVRGRPLRRRAPRRR